MTELYSSAYGFTSSKGLTVLTK